MRDHLFLYLNGEPVRVQGSDAFETLSGWLRGVRRMTGTKIVCEEGDCGACTVLIGRVAGDRIVYQPVNACIQHVYNVDGAHVVTVEGLGTPNALSPVQAAMVTHHGAQCGFCTPGFVAAMTALFEADTPPDTQTVREGLTGNLCRCTGYEPIVRAALAVEDAPRLNEVFPPEGMLDALRQASTEAVRVEHEGFVFYAPTTPEDAAQFKATHPGALIVQGGTDVGVWCNKRAYTVGAALDVARVPGMTALAEADGVLAVGGSVTLAALEAFVRDRVPEFYRILHRFGSPQIRAAGTLAGNLANGSPIADTVPFLFVMDAEVELFGPDGARRVNVNRFYTGYKTLDLAPGEFIARIHIPLPQEGETLRLYKVARRHDLDISTFTAAFRLRLEGDRIASARIAYGGVGPTVLRLPQTEAFLTGRVVEEETFVTAGALAQSEIAPLSDVRGAKDFRLLLAETILLKLYHSLGAEVAA